MRDFDLEEFEADIESEENNDNDGEIIDGVNLKKLRIWYRGKTTLVGKMIRFLYTKNKEITFEEFKEGVGYTGSAEQFMSNLKNGGSLKSLHGKIWNFTENRIILNNKIKQILNIY